jgi:DNA polymerase epsilon subunit 1
VLTFLSFFFFSYSQVPEAFDKLISGVEHAMSHAIEQEEKIPLSMVTNFNDVVADIKCKLTLLRDNPHCSERPIIYHLDVGRRESSEIASAVNAK